MGPARTPRRSLLARCFLLHSTFLVHGGAVDTSAIASAESSTTITAALLRLAASVAGLVIAPAL